MPNPYHVKKGSPEGGQFTSNDRGTTAGSDQNYADRGSLFARREEQDKRLKAVKVLKDAAKQDTIVTAARSAAGLNALKKDDVVEFAKPMPDELDKAGKSVRMKILEDRGDRVLVEDQVGMEIKPTRVVAKADLKPAGNAVDAVEEDRKSLADRYDREAATTNDWRKANNLRQAAKNVRSGSGALGPDAKKAAEMEGITYGFLSEEGVKRAFSRRGQGGLVAQEIAKQDPNKGNSSQERENNARRAMGLTDQQVKDHFAGSGLQDNNWSPERLAKAKSQLKQTYADKATLKNTPANKIRIEQSEAASQAAGKREDEAIAKRRKAKGLPLWGGETDSDVKFMKSPEMQKKLKKDIAILDQYAGPLPEKKQPRPGAPEINARPANNLYQEHGRKSKDEPGDWSRKATDETIRQSIIDPKTGKPAEPKAKRQVSSPAREAFIKKNGRKPNPAESQLVGLQDYMIRHPKKKGK